MENLPNQETSDKPMDNGKINVSNQQEDTNRGTQGTLTRKVVLTKDRINNNRKTNRTIKDNKDNHNINNGINKEHKDKDHKGSIPTNAMHTKTTQITTQGTDIATGEPTPTDLEVPSTMLGNRTIQETIMDNIFRTTLENNLKGATTMDKTVQITTTDRTEEVQTTDRTEAVQITDKTKVVSTIAKEDNTVAESTTVEADA